MVVCYRNTVITVSVLDQEENICLFTLNMSFSIALAVCSIPSDLYIRQVLHLWANSHTRSQMTVCSYTNLSKIKVCEVSQTAHCTANELTWYWQRRRLHSNHKPKIPLSLCLNMYLWVFFVTFFFNMTFETEQVIFLHLLNTHHHVHHMKKNVIFGALKYMF